MNTQKFLQPGLALALLCRAVRRAVHDPAGPDRIIYLFKPQLDPLMYRT
jgi:hypothetical protein